MHGPQISKENLHTVLEHKNGSPQEKLWVIVTEWPPACCVSNNNAELSARERFTPDPKYDSKRTRFLSVENVNDSGDGSSLLAA